ncbi:MAG: S4 domain-containing protein, partial [Methylophilus sp.]
MARPFKTPKPGSPAKRPAAPQPPVTQTEGEESGTTPRAGHRLHKLLALAGFGSRRDMETLIESGRITINGQVALVGAIVD